MAYWEIVFFNDFSVNQHFPFRKYHFAFFARLRYFQHIPKYES